MRKDICRYFEGADIDSVFKAYMASIKQNFTPKCSTRSNDFIRFKYSASLRYNMNGGVCSLYLMPYKEGTAVCIRYTIYQAVAGFYQKHEQDMLYTAENLLHVKGEKVNIPFSQFGQTDDLPDGPVVTVTYEPLGPGAVLIFLLLWLLFSLLGFGLAKLYFPAAQNGILVVAAVAVAWIIAMCSTAWKQLKS